MSDSDKTVISHRKLDRAGTKIGWAPEAARTPAPPYPARSFVLQDDDAPNLSEQQTVLAPRRHADGTVPPPYASELDAETTLAPVRAVPVVPALAYAPPLAQPPLAQPAPQPRYPTYPRASRFCEATAEITSSRAAFVRRAYVYLFISLLAYGGLVYLLTTNDVLVANISAQLTFALDGWNWAAVLGAYMGVSWIADFWARHTTSRTAHYLGLGIYIVAAALIFVPILAIVEANFDVVHIARDSAVTLLAVFTMLTASALLSRRRFSFLRSALAITLGAGASLAAMSLAYGFDLGLACAAGAAFLGGMYVLGQTAGLFEDRADRHVAGALVLLAAIPLVVWSAIRACLRRLHIWPVG